MKPGVRGYEEPLDRLDGRRQGHLRDGEIIITAVDPITQFLGRERSHIDLELHVLQVDLDPARECLVMTDMIGIDQRERVPLAISIPGITGTVAFDRRDLPDKP